ncbi:MAG: phosphatidylserine decarboxylase family protein [Nitrospiraceae bacterium]|nr:phosphatidylserine decarboxylase family protein [Nitrospiraceae bacterium]
MRFFAPEGYPYFALFAGISGLTLLLGGGILTVLPVLLLGFMFYFFRDPERTVPQEEGIYVSPADGRIIVTEEIYEGEYLESRALLVSIFMSPLNVHVNRAPCDVEVKQVKYKKGSFKKAFSAEAFHKNEHISTVMEETGPDRKKLLVRQVAGSIAQKAVCRKKPGDTLSRGERFGIIKFSSRVDVYLPTDVELAVEIGTVVRAGETVLARKRR